MEHAAEAVEARAPLLKQLIEGEGTPFDAVVPPGPQAGQDGATPVDTVTSDGQETAPCVLIDAATNVAPPDDSAPKSVQTLSLIHI